MQYIFLVSSNCFQRFVQDVIKLKKNSVTLLFGTIDINKNEGVNKMSNTISRTPSFIDNLKEVMKPMARGAKLWENARFVLADVPLDRSAVKSILPLYIRLRKKPMATLFIVDYTKTSFTVPYREAALLVHVRTLLGSGFHCPWMLVDDDTGLIYGREFLGFPKKFGKFSFQEKEDRITASVTRRGIEILKMEGLRGQAENSPSPVFDVKTFNAGGPGQLFAIQPIWLFRAKEVIREAYSADVKVTIGESEYDPIARLISGEPINGRIVAMDILRSKYNLPVGLAGIKWFINSYVMRFR